MPEPRTTEEMTAYCADCVVKTAHVTHTRNGIKCRWREVRESNRNRAPRQPTKSVLQNRMRKRDIRIAVRNKTLNLNREAQSFQPVEVQLS